jgi:hypothetical protein
MAFKHGKNAELLLDGVDVSGYLNSIDTAVSVEPAETTTFKKSWKTFISGLASATISAGGFYDPALTAVRTALQTAKVVTLGPAGASTQGDPVRMGEARTNSYAESSKIGEAVGFAWVSVCDELSFGQVVHPLGSESTDASGSAMDGSASSADGAFAHLHVTAISGTADITIEDSADGSTDWQVIGTFAQAATTGAERLTISGTVRRYVRVTWNLSVSGSTTFAVSMARR